MRVRLVARRTRFGQLCSARSSATPCSCTPHPSLRVGLAELSRTEAEALLSLARLARLAALTGGDGAGSDGAGGEAELAAMELQLAAMELAAIANGALQAITLHGEHDP